MGTYTVEADILYKPWVLGFFFFPFWKACLSVYPRPFHKVHEIKTIFITLGCYCLLHFTGVLHDTLLCKRSTLIHDPLEKGMAIHCSTLAWRIPSTGGLWFTGWQRVGHD